MQRVALMRRGQWDTPAQCAIPEGMTETCNAGVDQCPPDIDCQGNWSGCDARCCGGFRGGVIPISC